ncbi:hypothetical protein [Alcanivorax sp. 1008]|uniref:hypothetical protein n=1 Tax=Alcanivorax sp. 1008 TaxID=2816853 RepID=UPI001DFC38DE|nr:hypothetical protein [Alcanivorax sp. 1008]MCC1495279.1 hypothetical protein [Alcanivorax sp. 1008]
MSNATLPPSLDSLLKADTALGEKLRTAASQPSKGLTLPSLPAALATKTHAEAIDGELLLIAQTSAVAQMLCFHGPRLAKEAGLNSFTVRVQTVHEPVQQRSSLKAPLLDPGAAAVLRDAARHCDYQPLAEVLARLANLASDDTASSDQKD